MINPDYCTPQNGTWNNGYFISRIGPDDPMIGEFGYEMTLQAMEAERKRIANGPTLAHRRREFKKKLAEFHREWAERKDTP